MGAVLDADIDTDIEDRHRNNRFLALLKVPLLIKTSWPKSKIF